MLSPHTVGERAAVILDAIEAHPHFERLRTSTLAYSQRWVTFTGLPLIAEWDVVVDGPGLFVEAVRTMAMRAAVYELTGDERAAELAVSAPVDEMLHALAAQLTPLTRLQTDLSLTFVSSTGGRSVGERGTRGHPVPGPSVPGHSVTGHPVVGPPVPGSPGVGYPIMGYPAAGYAVGASAFGARAVDRSTSGVRAGGRRPVGLRAGGRHRVDGFSAAGRPPTGAAERGVPDGSDVSGRDMAEGDAAVYDLDGHTDQIYRAAGWGEPPRRFWLGCLEARRRLDVLYEHYESIGIHAGGGAHFLTFGR